MRKKRLAFLLLLSQWSDVPAPDLRRRVILRIFDEDRQCTETITTTTRSVTWECPAPER